MLSHAAKNDPAMSGQLDYDRNDADFYPTPPENVDCLHLVECLDDTVWWEPACGEGHISKRVQELTGKSVISTDLYHRGYGNGGIDFLNLRFGLGTINTLPPNREPDGGPTFKFETRVPKGIITNPPYGDLAEEFIRKALELMEPVQGKVAMFLRNEYDCGKERRSLFAQHPFAHKVIVTKRPRWIEGSKGSPRHSYAWYVWDFAHEGGAYISYVHPEDCPTLRTKK